MPRYIGVMLLLLTASVIVSCKSVPPTDQEIALQYLETLRSGDPEVPILETVERLEATLKRGGLSIRDIGGTLKEIVGFRVDGYAQMARRALHRLRTCKLDPDLAAYMLIVRLQQARLNLSNVGTDWEELEELLFERCQNARLEYPELRERSSTSLRGFFRF